MARLLDVGCGDGGYAVSRKWHQSYDYRGVDVDPDKIAVAKGRGLTVERADVESLPYPDASFDRVVAKAVFEHVADPQTAVQECHRVLRPGGQLWAVVPSDRSYDLWGDYTHKRAFRRDALADLLEDGGFDRPRITISGRMGWDSIGMAVKSVTRILSPWTPYGYPRAYAATVTKHG